MDIKKCLSEGKERERERYKKRKKNVGQNKKCEVCSTEGLLILKIPASLHSKSYSTSVISPPPAVLHFMAQ